jgi:uncharacterized protein YfiM (DUF2279 family)
MSRANGSERRVPPALLITVAILLIAPRPASAQDDWFGPDKLLHFLGGFFVTSVGYTFAATALDMEHEQARAFGVGAGVMAGIGKEVWDGLSGRGDPSGKDLFWDGIGIGLGVVLVNGPLRIKETPLPGDGLRVLLARPSPTPLPGLVRPLFPLPVPSPSGPFPAARNPLTIHRVPVP